MRLHRLTRGFLNGACALAAMTCILLALATTASASTDSFFPPQPASPAAGAPTIVKETVVRHDGGTGAIVFILIGIGTGVAVLAAGYIGARTATHGNPVPPAS